MRILFMAVLLASVVAAPAFAGHEDFQAKFRGSIQQDTDRDGRLERTRITEVDFLSDPANFLVVNLDVVSTTTAFTLEEWSDSIGADGIPDTFVSEIATESAMMSIENARDTSSRFRAVLTATDTDLDNDGTEDFNGQVLCDGRARTDGSSATRWSCRVSGPAHDQSLAGEGFDTYIKGTLSSVGDEL